MDAVRQLILDRAAELKRSLKEVSLKVGKNHAYLQQFIYRGIPKELPEKVRPSLAKELGVPDESLKGPGTKAISTSIDQPEKNSTGRNPAERKSFSQIPGAQLIGERDLPVFATSQGGKGAIILSSDPVDWVVRPEPLARVKDGYGIIVTEDSMEPEFRSGDTALVNPHLPPRAGDTCVFRGHLPDGTIVSCIKSLRRQTADSWQVTEWNSDEGKKRDFTLKKSEWQICHVTVGKYSRR